VILVKLGGGATLNLAGAADDLAALGQPCVVVHGANALRDELAAKLGVARRTLTSVSGVASVYTDDAALDVMLMAYSGLRNKRLVELLQTRGANAVGLTGLDGRCVQGRRNRGIRVREDGKQRMIHDVSGKPQSAGPLLGTLLAHGYLPVLTVPIADEEGRAINAENDDVVAVLQASLRADAVVHLIEAPGFLADPADPGSLLREIPRADLERREAKSNGRMKRKMMAIRRLFDAGAREVRIADGRVAHPLRDALAGAGTVIR
jgi:acetylglutamate/LysW-gamma-L-alpha-aminoadipate kinase